MPAKCSLSRATVEENAGNAAVNGKKSRKIVDANGRLDDIGIETTRTLSGSHHIPQRDACGIQSLQALLIGQSRARINEIAHDAQQALASVDLPRHLRIETGHDAERIRLRVADNGAGVSQADRERIFDAFLQK